MGKRNMRKGGMKPKKGCPKCEGEVSPTHNSPDWYSRELVPQVGANFSVLTTMGVEPRLLTNGMYVNALCAHYCVVSPPIDEHSSMHYKMAELYTELREINAGASNYTPVDLGCYIHNVVLLRMMCAHIRRGLSAIRHGSTLYRESPNIFASAAGLYDYSAESAAYAQNYNDAALLFKDIEKLPVPALSLLDRMEFIFDKVFVDSQTTRPAMITFIPTDAFTAASTAPGQTTGVYSFTHVAFGFPNAGASLSALIAQARTIYNSVVGVALNAIIRGDMIKAFGASAIRQNLVSQINSPFSMGYSPDVVAQLENAAIIGMTLGASVACSLDVSGGAALLTAPRNNSYSAYILDETNRIINFHGEQAPRDAALQAITRLAVCGENGSTIKITSTSGITIGATIFLNIQSGVTSVVTNMTTAIGDTHSSIQSTVEAAYKAMLTMCTLVDHFPMVIHHPGDTTGAYIDVDNVAYISAATLSDMTELANRSLLDSHIPRRADGRFDKGTSR